MQNKPSIIEYDTPKTFKEAKKMCSDLLETIDKTHHYYREQIEFLKQQYKIALRNLRPNIVTNEVMESLFDEAEMTQAVEEKEKISNAESQTNSSKKTRKKKQKAIPDHLPRTIMEHDLPESEKICSNDGNKLSRIGFDKKEELKYIPAKFEVIEHRFFKYACGVCEDGIKRQDPPTSLIPQSYASSELLTHIAVSKFCHHLPLYRQESIYQKHGIYLTRQVMSDWMIKLGEAIDPLVKLMHNKILESEVISADETPVKLLTKNGIRTSAQCYMWQLSRWGPNPLIIFEYDQSRKKGVAERLIKDYQGYVQVDGYAGYDVLFKWGSRRIRIGCLAHCLRKFKDLLASITKEKRAQHPANEIVALMKELYKIEHSCRGLTYEERFEKRKASNAEKIFDQLEDLVAKEMMNLSSKSPYYRALRYSSDELPLIRKYLHHGMIEIDNNFTENAIRPFALGRRNWLFICSERGAQASANIYSLLVTAKANNIDPSLYLQKVIERLPYCNETEDYAALLPSAHLN